MNGQPQGSQPGYGQVNTDGYGGGGGYPPPGPGPQGVRGPGPQTMSGPPMYGNEQQGLQQQPPRQTQLSQGTWLSVSTKSGMFK